MANPTEKHHLNIPGSFYNDTTCVDCSLCPEIAPAIFRRDAASAGSYVWRQPVLPEEIELAKQALEQCPTESIESDG